MADFKGNSEVYNYYRHNTVRAGLLTSTSVSLDWGKKGNAKAVGPKGRPNNNNLINRLLNANFLKWLQNKFILFLTLNHLIRR